MKRFLVVLGLTTLGAVGLMMSSSAEHCAYLDDHTGIFLTEEKQGINKRLHDVYKKTDIYLFVLIVQDNDPNGLEHHGLQAFEGRSKWNKFADRVLLIVDVDDEVVCLLDLKDRQITNSQFDQHAISECFPTVEKWHSPVSVSNLVHVYADYITESQGKANTPFWVYLLLAFPAGYVFKILFCEQIWGPLKSLLALLFFIIEAVVVLLRLLLTASSKLLPFGSRRAGLYYHNNGKGKHHFLNGFGTGTSGRFGAGCF